ncbi:MAG: hypothetical protein OEL88_09000 [Sterolibacteriaceae bacterium MAG5]|nr:hypothetical protein [Candidatus Nitricoxidireducens bremensis]
MARYKFIDTSPQFLAVDHRRQRPPSRFEHELHHPVDKEIGADRDFGMK